MLVNFETLPEHSRIWIYQADRTFSESEISEIREAMDNFLTEWTAHGAQLQAGYEIPYNRFIVIGLDQSAHAASGCSIDASVHFIQALEKKFGVVLLDRMNVSFKQGPHIAYKPLSDFRKLVKNKSVSKNTVVFNNLVTNKLEYSQQWEVPASESWHARLFSK